MRNQIAAAERAGIRAVTINSTNIESWEPIHDAIRAGEVDVLLVSPERLNNPGFRDEVLPRLAATCGLLVVDEAHCISDWGHDFRPDYRRIRTLLAELPEGIPVLATTATANARVTQDVAEQLGAEDDVLVLRGSLDRESLRLGVVRLKTAEQRLAWLADHLAEQPGVGIVYCLTVAATQEIADYLRSRGHHVAAYSGQTETTERLALEEDLLAGRVKALIATSALGMGFDATLGFVVNMGAPAVAGGLLPAGRPRRARHRRGHRGAAAGDRGPRHLGLLRLAVLPPRGAGPRDPRGAGRRGATGRAAGARDPRRPQPLPARDDAQGARRRRRRTPGQGRAGSRPGSRGPTTRSATAGSARPASASRPRCSTTSTPTSAGCGSCAEQLDDPEAADCGRCDNCGGLTLDAAVSAEAVEQAEARLARPGVPIEPRKMWPTALANLGIDLKGKIREPAEEGRAIARLTDLGHGQALRALFRPDTEDGPVPPALVQAMLTLLDDWRPDVDAIVVVESLSRPTLTDDLAAGLSRRLQVPVVGRWAIVDPDVAPGQGRVQLRPARGRRGPPRCAAGRRRPGLPGAARRRPRGHRLDAHPCRPGDPRGRARTRCCR